MSSQSVLAASAAKLALAYPALVRTHAEKANVTLDKAQKLWDTAKAQVRSDNPRLTNDAIFYGMVTKRFQASLGLRATDTPSRTTTPATKASSTKTTEAEGTEPKYPPFVISLSKSDDKILAATPLPTAKKLWNEAFKVCKAKGLEGSKLWAHSTVLFKALVHQSYFNFGTDPKILKDKALTTVINKLAKAFGIEAKDVTRYFNDTITQFTEASNYKPNTPTFVNQTIIKVLERCEFKRKKLARGDFSVTSSLLQRVRFVHKILAESTLEDSLLPLDFTAPEPTPQATSNLALVLYKFMLSFEPLIFQAVGASNFSKLEDGLQFDVANNKVWNGTISITYNGNGSYTLTCSTSGSPVRKISGLSKHDLVPYLFKVTHVA